VVTVNLVSGALTPFVRHLTQATGLVYLHPCGTQTELALNGAPEVPTAPATRTGAGKTTGSSTTSVAVQEKSGESHNTALIAMIAVAATLLLGGVGFAFSRRATAVRSLF
jgi:hypothetical protein